MSTENLADEHTSKPGNTGRTGGRRDLIAAGFAVLLVAAAIVVGRWIEDTHGTLHLNWPPLYAKWQPHLGPGTPAAVAVAAAVIAYGPTLARRLRWRTLLLASWAGSMAWIWSLALIDGWHRGIAERLTTKYEYLQVIDRFADIPSTLRGFTGHILIDSPDHWPAHIAGHPPGATLTFVLLDRIGLGGGAWAGAFCITVGSTAVVAVLLTVRALADGRRAEEGKPGERDGDERGEGGKGGGRGERGEELARKAAPFLVLAPAAIWIGASADGYFAAVTAWMTALLALAATRAAPRTPLPRRAVLAALGSGLLFGLTVYLSYGLTLFAIVVAAVLLITRTWRPLPWFLAGAAVVPLVFLLLGFDWWEAYHLLVERYHQGAGGIRPYGYFIWANPACTVLVVGLATVAGLRRVLARSPKAVRASLTPTGRDAKGGPERDAKRGPEPQQRLVLLTLAALLALAVADLSGMSKAETERIWLPFATFLLPAAALLPTPGRRFWLTTQAALALTLNHLLFTGW
ncbi:hypothetical protein [Streptomyces sp. NPDC002851]